MRLFAASLATETNTFSPIPTSRANFEASAYFPAGQHPDRATHTTAPLYVARQRARIAQVIPPDSPLREFGLSLSILRRSSRRVWRRQKRSSAPRRAPLPDPQPWAEHALSLQRSGELRVRRFARLLEAAEARFGRGADSAGGRAPGGLRQRRPAIAATATTSASTAAAPCAKRAPSKSTCVWKTATAGSARRAAPWNTS